jgi:hypothetical protein
MLDGMQDLSLKVELRLSPTIESNQATPFLSHRHQVKIITLLITIN